LALWGLQAGRNRVVTKEETQGTHMIVNALGLHARAASKLVGMANRFSSDVWIVRDGNEVNGKSILGVLMLACAKGTQVTIRCVGSDSAQAYTALAKLVDEGFGES
jgi:phosphocarrier protein